MAKFASIEDGELLRKPVVLPLLGATWSPEKGVWEGATIDLDVRVLTPSEDLEVLRLSREFAKAKGVEKPEDGEPIYDYAIRLHTVLLGAVDRDSLKTDPVPFFASLAEIVTSKRICQDQVNYLYEQQREHQDAVAPRPGSLSPAQFMATAVAIAGGNLDFFVSLRPSTRWIFTRTLAAQHIDSLMRKSLSGSGEEPTSETSTKSG